MRTPKASPALKQFLRERFESCQISQAELSRVSGIAKPNISDFVYGVGYTGILSLGRIAISMAAISASKTNDKILKAYFRYIEESK